ncbi:hypothetical protein Q361_1731, partial [Flavobacterium croceum DSM 17960]
GITKTISFTYPDFNLSTSGDGSLFLNALKDFNVFLSQIAQNNAITYQVRYSIASGSTGNGQVLANNTPVPLGVYAPIALGSTSLQFKGTTVGTVNLLVEVKDSNGLVHSSTVAFNVTAVTFTFSAAAQPSSLYVGQSSTLNFNISESAQSGNTYEMMFLFQASSPNGGGTIYDNNSALSAGVWYPVNVGSFIRTLNSTQVGNINILFKVRNTQTLQEVSQLVGLNIQNSSYTLVASPNLTNVTIGNTATISGSINTIGPAQQNFTMTYSTSGTGTLVYNGVYISPGQSFAMSAGAFNMTYIGTSAGIHNVALNCSNNTLPVISMGTSFDITFSYPDFNLSTSGDGSLLLNTQKDFNVYLSQITTAPYNSYLVKFTLNSGSTGSGQIFKNNLPISYGTYNPIGLGNNGYQFKATAVGNVSITCEVKDNNGIVHTSILTFGVTGISYTFSAAAQNSSLQIGESSPINFDITESTPSGTNYEMKYVFQQGNGTISNGSNAVSTNVWEPVNIGSYNRTFTATTIGTVKILFTVRNALTLVEATQVITINATQNTSTYTFTANNVLSSTMVGNSIPFNFVLTQSGTAQTNYTMLFTTTGNGNFVYNGTTYTNGQAINIVPGSFSGVYTGTSAGNHNVTFTVTNNQTPPVSTSVTKTLTFNASDFNLSTSGDGSLFLNTQKDFNVFLSQIAVDNSITYQVRYTVASGSTGNGQVLANNTPVQLGIYAPISLGSTSLQFKGTSVGTVNLLVEV